MKKGNGVFPVQGSRNRGKMPDSVVGTDERELTVVIGAGEAGSRLDTALAALCPGLSRSSIQRLIREKRVTRDGKPVKAGLKVEKGWAFSLAIPDMREPTAGPEDIPLSILYEDDDLVVVDKPSGMVSHPGPGNLSGTLVNALLFHCKGLSGVGGIQRPGIVHRLDKGTSGIMVAAKNDEAHRHLSALFKAQEVKKVYLAVVWDNIIEESGTIEASIGRDSRDRKKISLKTRKPREAATDFFVRYRFGTFTLLELHPRSGRTHQIRVHLAHIKHPVVGDPLYGRRTDKIKLPMEWRKVIARLDRPLLHAYSLSFPHPTQGRTMEFVAPPPEDFRPFLPGESW
jgi:23S rRNA pseudouridine1911/1915/1917 synthase